MPACPVDTEWHHQIKQPKQYRALCRRVVGCEVRHEPAKGKGRINWSKTYEKLFGQLPAVWFRDTNRILDQARRQKYLQTGIFEASWDCTPG